jgi:hypothetical protein
VHPHERACSLKGHASIMGVCLQTLGFWKKGFWESLPVPLRRRPSYRQEFVETYGISLTVSAG